MFTSYMSMKLLNDHAEQGKKDVEINNFRVEDWMKAKGPDFKSRLFGILDILGVNRPAEVVVREPGQDAKIHQSLRTDPYGYHIRRAIILRDELRKLYPHLFDEDDVLSISTKVREAFLETEQFVHGARSIRQIVQMSSVGARRSFDASCVPTASQLRLHVAPKEFERWFGDFWIPGT